MTNLHAVNTIFHQFLSLQQSGNESRSRAESLASNSLADTNDDGEFIDYKALYEAAK